MNNQYSLIFSSANIYNINDICNRAASLLNFIKKIKPLLPSLVDSRGICYLKMVNLLLGLEQPYPELEPELLEQQELRGTDQRQKQAEQHTEE